MWSVNRLPTTYRPHVLVYQPRTDCISILTDHIPTTLPATLPTTLPTTYRPHTDHVTDHIPTTLPTTYRPHTDHIPTTFRPHTDHIPTTYRPRTNHIPTTYRPHTDHVPTTLPTTLPTTYRPRYRPRYQPHTDRLYRPHTDSSTCFILPEYPSCDCCQGRFSCKSYFVGHICDPIGHSVELSASNVNGFYTSYI